MNKKKKNNQGFTLLELMVSISIMLVLITIFLMNFKGIENKQLLENEKEELITILKQAQIYALVGQTINDERYNYGVHITNCSAGTCEYILFKDAEDEGNKRYDDGEKIESHKTSGKIEIRSDDLYPVKNNALDIVFEVPFGNIYFNGVDSDEEAEINIRYNMDETKKTITINGSSGQIE